MFDKWSAMWILDENHKPKEVSTLLEWAEWAAKDNARRVALTDIGPNVYVSTVFLGITHGFDEAGNPLLFETMIFGIDDDSYQRRFSSWEEAKRGHEIAVFAAKCSLGSSTETQESPVAIGSLQDSNKTGGGDQVHPNSSA